MNRYLQANTRKLKDKSRKNGEEEVWMEAPPTSSEEKPTTMNVDLKNQEKPMSGSLISKYDTRPAMSQRASMTSTVSIQTMERTRPLPSNTMRIIDHGAVCGAFGQDPQGSPSDLKARVVGQPFKHGPKTGTVNL